MRFWFEIPERSPLTLRIRWAHLLTANHGRVWQLVVEENDDDFGWVLCGPLADFPERFPEFVEFLPSARDEELPPWT